MAASEETSIQSRELSWPLDEIQMEGTLTYPAGMGPRPGIVFVAGSGPTDRNWNSPLLPGSNGSGRLVAEALAQAGYVTLRYDKRASGPHIRENMERLIGKVSFQSHLDELTAAVEQLAAQPEVDAGGLFVLTNSEGALHALNYQVHDPRMPFSGMVLTAPPGRPVGAVAHMQIAAQTAVVPDGEHLLQVYDEAVARFVAGQPVDVDPSLPEGMRMMLGGITAPVNQPFARELWLTDPAAWLAEVTVPVLVLIGLKDVQVDWQADGQPLEQAAAGHSNVTFVYPPDANHVLKHEARPRSQVDASAAMAYSSPDTALDDEAVAAIINWLKAHE